jgi:predicted AlkP superfamily pyrophosphatase or phosphodiesterase
LLNEQETYTFGDSDDRPWEVDLGGFGRIFPHAYGDGSGKYFTTTLTTSPAGDEITLDFAKALIVEEQLGQDDVTDYLSISFSSTDYVGHLFGASSLESEDNILRLDQTLARLFEFVNQQVGLDNTLIVLSADHGGPDSPGYLNSLGIPAGYVDPKTWDTQDAIKRLKEEFGISGKIMLSRFPGVALAVSSSALRKGNVPDTALYGSVLKNFHPKRSGEVYVVFEPNWFINDFDGLVVASTHGSPWPYDTWVPIVFAGMDIAPDTVMRKVHTVDIATTLSAYVGVKPPSGAVGDVLEEVFK